MTESDTDASETTQADEYIDFPTEEEMRHGPDEDRAWMILFPEDFDTHLFDSEDQLALLVDEDQAREVKRLAERAIAICGGEPGGDDAEEHRIELSQFDLDHLNGGQPVFKGVAGEDFRLVLYSDAPLEDGDADE